jgi:hypothetical protein
MTINKSQGQSLKIIRVFFKDQVFTHGQFYVALLRVTLKKGLKIIMTKKSLLTMQGTLFTMTLLTLSQESDIITLEMQIKIYFLMNSV